jgi:glucose-6-phosphate 1-dehydrogenase
MIGEEVNLVEHQRLVDKMEPYERLIGDALRGDRMLFGNEGGVEAAWRIVEPVLGDVTPVDLYEPLSWGPAGAEGLAAGFGGWCPIVLETS